MNAYSKILTGAMVAMTLLMVACGKSHNNGAGNSGGGVGVNCIQMGAACVPGAPGQITNGGTWRGDLGNDAIGSLQISITMRPSQSGFGGGGLYGAGYPGAAPIQTMVELSIRRGGRMIRGRGFATGGPGGFHAVIDRTSDRGIYIIDGAFGPQQNQMNVTINGALAVGGPLLRNVNQFGGQAGIGGGGYGFGGGYVQREALIVDEGFGDDIGGDNFGGGSDFDLGTAVNFATRFYQDRRSY